MMKKLLKLWCAPQHLVGFIFKVVTKAKKDERGLYIWNLNYGLSLGDYIFVNKNASEDTIKHELGHAKQSKLLGPLYLFVVSIPSAIWCHFFENYRRRNNISYYDFYCERWAERLGGVERK